MEADLISRSNFRQDFYVLYFFNTYAFNKLFHNSRRNICLRHTIYILIQLLKYLIKTNLSNNVHTAEEKNTTQYIFINTK